MNNKTKLKTISLHINGHEYTVRSKSHTNLLAYLRNELRLTGTKQGCGTGNCGACTVLINNRAVQACQVSLSAAANTDISTIESVRKTSIGSHITNTLTHYDAAQCGYCLPGIVMAAYAEILNKSCPDVINALQRNLCRCGTHTRILKALKEVIEEQGESA